MSDNLETAVLAGGCYWIVQQLLHDRAGVISTRAGWTGGDAENPTEENPGGHVEAVEVVFDRERISYRELLEFFFMIHRADLGKDVVGDAYRSAIFYGSEEQRMVAAATIRDVEAAGHWPGMVVTELSEAGKFWAAEDDDQGYLQRYPEGCASPFPRREVAAAVSDGAAHSS